MAGPMGGGGRGGGSHGGGFGGGHHGPGGFHGGPRGPYHRGPRFGYGYYHRPRFYGGWGWGPRYYGYGGGGCLGGLLGALMAPLILLLIVGVMMFGMIASTLTNVANGGIVSYNEKTFQDYADEQYLRAFGSSDATEDNILIVVLINEERVYPPKYIPWGGSNIVDEVSALFAERRDFDQAMDGTIQQYYANSLDEDLAKVMRTMTRKIANLNLKSSFYDEYSHENSPESKLINYTELKMTEKTVNDALVSFTEATEIPVVIVVEDMEDVFGKNLPMEDVIILVVLAALGVVAIVTIVRTVKNRDKFKDGNPEDDDRRDNNRW